VTQDSNVKIAQHFFTVVYGFSVVSITQFGAGAPDGRYLLRGSHLYTGFCVLWGFSAQGQHSPVDGGIMHESIISSFTMTTYCLSALGNPEKNSPKIAIGLCDVCTI